MSVDKVLRLDLWEMARKRLRDLGTQSGGPIPYRHHVVECDMEYMPLFSNRRLGSYLVDGEHRIAVFDNAQGALSAIKHIDYLIDVLDAVDEPALKGD